jgi:hypothetical protein
MRWRIGMSKGHGASRRATRWHLLALLILCRCAFLGSTTSGADEGFSGSSAPRASREPASVRGVFIGPGGGGVTAAEDLARRNCEQYDLRAEVGGAATVNGAVRLRYTCQ